MQLSDCLWCIASWSFGLVQSLLTSILDWHKLSHLEVGEVQSIALSQRSALSSVALCSIRLGGSFIVFTKSKEIPHYSLSIPRWEVSSSFLEGSFRIHGTNFTRSTQGEPCQVDCFLLSFDDAEALRVEPKTKGGNTIDKKGCVEGCEGGAMCNKRKCIGWTHEKEGALEYFICKVY